MAHASVNVHGFEEFQVLEDAGGARAVISRRRDGQLYTIAFSRTFEQDGEKRQTSFFKVSHRESLQRLEKIAWPRLEELQASVGSGSPDRRRT